MPIKKDETGKRWVELEVIVPGTPEQVWQAIATGPGNTAWWTKAAIEEHVGGAVHLDSGPYGRSEAEVTLWEPPVRFGYVEYEWAEGAPPIATEITVTARSGGRCVVRLVHSLFASTEDWDDQLEGFENGWPGYFEVLRLYLSHFAGRTSASFDVSATTEAPQSEVWKRLTEALGLAAANVGENRTTPEEPEPLTGTVERVQQSGFERYLLLRLTAPTAGIASIGIYGIENTTTVGMSLYFYGDDAGERAAASEAKWQDWFRENFEPASR